MPRTATPAANPVNRKKLPGSKWTAVEPMNREKHFVVLGWTPNPDGSHSTDTVDVEAVLTGRIRTIGWRELADPDRWRIGWC